MKLFDQIVEPCSFRRDMTPMTFKDARLDFEKQYLTELLLYCDGNIKLASEISGRDRKGLYAIMDKHGIRPSDYRGRTSVE